MLPHVFGNWPNLPWLPHHTIFMTKAGSHAYGMNTPTSDLDIRGVTCVPSNYLFGFSENFEQAVHTGQDVDCVIYSVAKFIALCAQCNPNAIEILFTDPSDHLLVTETGRKLLDNRDLFLSKRVRHTFSGYAHAQLKRIKTHRSWLLEAPKKPSRAEFGLPETTLIPADQLSMAEAAIKKEMDSWEVDLTGMSDASRIHLMGHIEETILRITAAAGTDKATIAGTLLGFSSEALTVLAQERKYAAALTHYRNYLTWQEKRNKDRAALESSFGYDTKHAAHLVRLLRMCAETLRGEGVNVKRKDADALLAIRRGVMSYDELMEFVNTIDPTLDEIYKTSPLPHAPNMKAIEALCIDIQQQVHATGRV